MLHYDVMLYHFTSDRHIDQCMLEGLTRGVIFTGRSCTGLHFLKNTQWLTSNPDFEQTWNEGSTLPYDRTANRLSICIPRNATHNLFRWITYGPALAAKTYHLLSGFGDPENWYIYRGVVRPEWIVETVKKQREKIYGTEKQT